MKSTASTSSKVTEDPWAYFQPGQMIFAIKHNNPSLSSDQIQRLFRWSNQIAEGLGLLVIPAKEPAADKGKNEQKEPKDEKEQQEAEEQKVYDDKIRNTLKKFKVPESRMSRVYSFSPKPELNKRFKEPIQPKDGIEYKSPQLQMPTPFTLISADVLDLSPQAKEGFVKDSKLAGLVIELERKLQGINNKSPQQPLDNGASLEAVTFNWLMGASSESGGTGGPGARPVPFTYETGRSGATLVNGREVMDYPFKVERDGTSALPERADLGARVKVAILDTAPSLHELSAAYERWHKGNPDRNGGVIHQLIEDLLRPNGPLTVHPASYSDLLRMRTVHLHEHNYNMTDHGLFVAGIIHRLAPAAELHLFEVLNPDGVGDLESIAKGLWEVFDQFAGEPLVVNCSLVLNIPLNGYQIPELDQQILKEIVDGWDEHNTYDYLETSIAGRTWLENQSQAIKWICDLLYLHGSKVIAAAGNDWEANRARPSARFPAAFESVVGVGALPKDQVVSIVGTTRYNTTPYSNISDRPEHIGVTTFGGEAGEGKGVLGLYIGEFPEDPNPPWWRHFLNWIIVHLGGRVAGPPNLTDMAWWAGTSFATPILTGTIAAILGRLQPARTEDAIVEAYNTRIITEHKTVGNEDAMDVIQP